VEWMPSARVSATSTWIGCHRFACTFVLFTPRVWGSVVVV
jgi:hypothetical protein